MNKKVMFFPFLSRIWLFVVLTLLQTKTLISPRKILWVFTEIFCDQNGPHKGFDKLEPQNYILHLKLHNWTFLNAVQLKYNPSTYNESHIFTLQHHQSLSSRRINGSTPALGMWLMECRSRQKSRAGELRQSRRYPRCFGKIAEEWPGNWPRKTGGFGIGAALDGCFAAKFCNLWLNKNCSNLCFIQKVKELSLTMEII